MTFFKLAINNIMKINYPRKCHSCDYLSNNPQMFHYHKQIHDEIPDDQLCDLGCGNLATVKTTGGQYSCQKISHQCPSSRKRAAERVKNDWEKPKSNSRRLEIRNRVIDPIEKKKQSMKSSETKRNKIGIFTVEQATDFRHYARRLRTKAQRWARNNGYDIGRQTYHIDHKLSILDAWKLGLSETIVNHPANLQILDAKINSGKGSKSSLTYEQLLENIKAYVELA